MSFYLNLCVSLNSSTPNCRRKHLSFTPLKKYYLVCLEFEFPVGFKDLSFSSSFSFPLVTTADHLSPSHPVPTSSSVTPILCMSSFNTSVNLPCGFPPSWKLHNQLPLAYISTMPCLSLASLTLCLNCST